MLIFKKIFHALARMSNFCITVYLLFALYRDAVKAEKQAIKEYEENGWLD